MTFDWPNATLTRDDDGNVQVDVTVTYAELPAGFNAAFDDAIRSGFPTLVSASVTSTTATIVIAKARGEAGVQFKRRVENAAAEALAAFDSTAELDRLASEITTA